ncbi:hypothetical protein V5O48_003767 [Marasmius crinis-equi]|uniref:Oxidoreductase n=1 Tax=Marasmius crinis-equi TaxID=585013 RepID=A0ABR3FRX7_9AGAR
MPCHPKFNPEKDIPSLTGKVFFVTGGTAGIGKESILLLAQHQPEHIFFSGRDLRRADAVIQEVKAVAPTAQVTFIQCDLASLESVKEAAAQFTTLSSRLHVLVCNAGIMAVPAALTRDGYEVQFGTNHVGHALLIKLLLPTLLHTAEEPNSDVRILTLSSDGHRFYPSGGIRFDALREADTISSAALRYGQSKLANVLYTNELARRYPNITSVSLHPGVVGTGLADSVTTVTKVVYFFTAAWREVKPVVGAYNQTWASTTEKSNLVNGRYYEPVGALTKVAKEASNEELAKRLWEWTENELKEF